MQFLRLGISRTLNHKGTGTNTLRSISRFSSTQPPQPITVDDDDKNVETTDEPQYFPNLMTPDRLLDTHEVAEFPPSRESPFLNRVIVRNDLGSRLFDPEESEPDNEAETEDEISPLSNIPLEPRELNKLYKFPILIRRVTQQTGKGKIHRQYCMMIVGNGDGLVGYGEGKDEDATRAADKAFAQAVRNMDWVERFEDRTIWTDIDSKLGATRVILRPRPVGFGLRCNPNIHQVLKAAGIKDISAKVWGSRNPMNVIKAVFRMLQAGNAPLSMGDGIGGSGRKLNKGSGIRSKSEVERERGRKLIDLRDWRYRWVPSALSEMTIFTLP
jgi:small subunit ribosomal protein S5